jgi:hypothetical protein
LKRLVSVKLYGPEATPQAAWLRETARLYEAQRLGCPHVLPIVDSFQDKRTGQGCLLTRVCVCTVIVAWAADHVVEEGASCWQAA